MAGQRKSDLGTKWLSPALTRVAARVKQSGDRQYGIFRYTTRLTHDNTEGNSALELHETGKDTDTKRVARVVFWDAYGDFFFETFDAQVPVVVAEQLMAEARAAIKVR